MHNDVYNAAYQSPPSVLRMRLFKIQKTVFLKYMKFTDRNRYAPVSQQSTCN